MFQKIKVFYFAAFMYCTETQYFSFNSSFWTWAIKFWNWVLLPTDFHYILMCTMAYEQFHGTGYMSNILYVGISGRHGSVRFIVGLKVKDLFQCKWFFKPMISFIIKSIICFTVWKFHHKHCPEIWTEFIQDPVFHAIALGTAFAFLHHRHT